MTTSHFNRSPAREWLMVRSDPDGPWHLHADGDTKGHRVRAACGGRIRPHDVQMSDLPPSCETCRETRLWRAIEQWEPDDEAE